MGLTRVTSSAESGGQADLSLLKVSQPNHRCPPWDSRFRFWWKLAFREIVVIPKLGAVLGVLVLSDMEIRDLVTILRQGMADVKEVNLIRVENNTTPAEMSKLTSL